MDIPAGPVRVGRRLVAVLRDPGVRAEEIDRRACRFERLRDERCTSLSRVTSVSSAVPPTSSATARAAAASRSATTIARAPPAAKRRHIARADAVAAAGYDDDLVGELHEEWQARIADALALQFASADRIHVCRRSTSFLTVRDAANRTTCEHAGENRHDDIAVCRPCARNGSSARRSNPLASPDQAAELRPRSDRRTAAAASAPAALAA
mgnify:CR=1 FL=1